MPSQPAKRQIVSWLHGPAFARVETGIVGRPANLQRQYFSHAEAALEDLISRAERCFFATTDGDLPDSEARLNVGGMLVLRVRKRREFDDRCGCDGADQSLVLGM
jgi:hypothetical protein